jgi:hypothetical protein
VGGGFQKPRPPPPKKKKKKLVPKKFTRPNSDERLVHR